MLSDKTKTDRKVKRVLNCLYCLEACLLLLALVVTLKSANAQAITSITEPPPAAAERVIRDES